MACGSGDAAARRRRVLVETTDDGALVKQNLADVDFAVGHHVTSEEGIVFHGQPGDVYHNIIGMDPKGGPKWSFATSWIKKSSSSTVLVNESGSLTIILMY